MRSRIYSTIMIIIRSYMSLSLTSLLFFQLTSAPAVIAANTASLLPSLAAFHNFKFKSLLLTVDMSYKNKLKKMYTVYIFLSLFLSDMSTNDLNLKLWNAARDGDNDAVLAAITDGSNVNWNNDSHVSDNNI